MKKWKKFEAFNLNRIIFNYKTHKIYQMWLIKFINKKKCVLINH